MLVGAGLAVYLSVWTRGWSGGAWPHHELSLDVIVTLGLVLGVALARARIAIVPAVGIWTHMILQARLVSAPRSLFEWGGASIGLGFALLIASLSASYWLRTLSLRGNGGSRASSRST
jgi:hypothetical protein